MKALKKKILIFEVSSFESKCFMLQLLSMSVKKRTTGQLMIVQTQLPTFNVQQEKQMSPYCYSTS